MSRRALVVGAWLGGGLLVGGCLPQAVTGEGQRISELYWIAMAMSAVVLLVVWLPLGVALLLSRRRRRDAGLPPQTRGSTLLEVLWTAGPLITIVILFVLTLAVLDAISQPEPADQAAAGETVSLEVTAFRWGWQMAYPEAGVVVTGLRDPGPTAVLPVGRPITIRLTATDVIHAFYVPEFLYKRDAVPGRVNDFTLTIEQAGTYTGQCAEFCGLFHDQMPFTIRAVEAAEFEQWLADAAQRSPVPVAPTPPPDPLLPTPESP